MQDAGKVRVDWKHGLLQQESRWRPAARPAPAKADSLYDSIAGRVTADHPFTFFAMTYVLQGLAEDLSLMPAGIQYYLDV